MKRGASWRGRGRPMLLSRIRETASGREREVRAGETAAAAACREGAARSSSTWTPPGYR